MSTSQLLFKALAPFIFLFLGCSNTPDDLKALEYVQRSAAYEKQGQYRAALIELRNAIRSDPSNISYVIYYGKLLVTVGSPNQAEDVLIAQKTDNNQAKLLLAEAMLLQGKFISALQVLSTWESERKTQSTFTRLSAIQQYLAGDKTTALSNLRSASLVQDAPLETKLEFIKLLMDFGTLDETIIIIEELLEDNPNNPTLLYLSARNAYHINNFEEAEDLLTEAILHLPETDILLPEKLQVLKLMSTVLTDMGRSSEAFIYSQYIRESNPDAYAAQQQFKDALEAAANGDLLAAKAAFEDILTQFPNNQQAGLLLGLIHLEEGNIESGESLLSENLEAEVAPVSLIQATALAQADQGKPEDAIRVLKKALLARPDDIALLSLYGVISLHSGSEVTGVNALKKALELDATRTRLRLFLAQNSLKNNNPSEALSQLHKAYRSTPNDWATTDLYLSTLLNQNQLDDARKVRSNLNKNFGRITSAQWIIAMTDYRLGDIQTAVDGLTAINRQNPKLLNPIIALARIYQQRKQWELASTMWLLAINEQPSNSKFISSLLYAKSQSLNGEALNIWLESEASNNPSITLPLHSALVELLVQSGDLSKAKIIASGHQSKSSKLVQLMNASILRGETIEHAQAGDWNGALSKVKKALTLQPDSINLTILVAKIYQEMDNPTEAIKLIDLALEKFPNSGRLINQKTKLLVLNQGNEEALAFISGYWTKNPNSEIAKLYLPLLKELKPNSLENAYRVLLAAEPNNEKIATIIAGRHLERGEMDIATKEYQHILLINPANVAALNNLAWILRSSEPDTALSHSQKAAELAPNSASVLDTYGWLLHLNGHRDKAIEFLQRALSLDNTNSEILKHLEEVQS